MRTLLRPPLRTLVRVVAVVPVLASLSFVGSTTKVGPAAFGCAQASSAHHAALVAEHGDGRPVVACVAFSGDSITGEQLLSLASQQGVQYATADYGSTGKAVCQIDNEPAQYPSSCWTASSRYWAMFVSRGGASWSFSSLGISSQTFRDGDAEGFRYERQGEGSVPPSPAGVCPPPATATPAPVSPAPATESSAATPRTGSQHATSRASPVTTTPGATSTPTGVGTPPPAAIGVPPMSPGVAFAAGPSPVRPPPSPPPPGAAAWIAAVAAAALVLLLVVQLVRSRRPSPARSQQ